MWDLSAESSDTSEMKVENNHQGRSDPQPILLHSIALLLCCSVAPFLGAVAAWLIHLSLTLLSAVIASP